MNGGMHLTPIGSGVVLLEPKEGLDPSDPDAYLDGLLHYLQGRAARRLVYDAGAVVIIDAVYYRWLARLAAACRVTGIDVTVVNMRPSAAFALARQLDDDPPFACALDVDHARY